MSQEIYHKKCCLINHISEFTSNEKKSILEYYQKLSDDHNRENDYLKGLVIPVPIKEGEKNHKLKTKNLNLNTLNISLKQIITGERFVKMLFLFYIE